MKWRSLDPTALGTARQMGRGMLPLLAVLMILVSAADLNAGEHQMGEAMSGHGAGAGTRTPFATMMDTAMTVMDGGMKQAPITGDPDHDFAAMMIPHHQGAIDMAKAELLYGKDPVLRRLAQEIIVTQNAEITVMQRELEKRTVGGSPSR